MGGKVVAMKRPGPLRWIWYAFGGRLGPDYREWVLFDITCRTRWWRQLARAVVLLVPFALLLFAVLGVSWITWAALLGGLFMALIYSAAYIDQAGDHRLLKHGFPQGTAGRVRAENRPEQEAARRRYEETYRSSAAD